MTLALETRAPAPDFTAIKQRHQATWASGDYSIIGTTLQIVGKTLGEAVDLRAGERVLDVAAGNGNATLAAARRHAEVTSTDYVQALLERARQRAQAEGARVRFETADAENLPFADGSFDVVLSVFGVVFASDQERAAGAMLRVVRSGGRIGLASWTPASFIGRLFKIVGSHVPPPPASSRPPCGAPSRASSSCSVPAPPASAASGATSTSAIAPPPTGCRCSATTTARPTRPSRHSIRPRTGAGARHPRSAGGAERGRARFAAGAQRVPGSRHHRRLRAQLARDTQTHTPMRTSLLAWC